MGLPCNLLSARPGQSRPDQTKTSGDDDEDDNDDSGNHADVGDDDGSDEDDDDDGGYCCGIDDGGADDDGDRGGDGDDDRAGDDDDAFLSCDALIEGRSFLPLSLKKPYVLPTPKSCFFHSEAIHGWKPTASSTYISRPRPIPPLSQPLLPQCGICLEA